MNFVSIMVVCESTFLFWTQKEKKKSIFDRFNNKRNLKYEKFDGRGK